MSGNRIGGGAGFGIAAAVIMTVCCLGPAVLTGAGLVSAGALFTVPAAGMIGIAAAAVGVAGFVRRGRRRRNHGCCTPPDRLDDERMQR